MIAGLYRGSGVFQLEERPMPQPGPHDVVVKVAACGICGTDLHILRDEYDSRPPVVLGHELAGEIVAVGKSVLTLSIGDLVTVEPHIYCGECRFCLRGQEHLCISKKAFGVHLDGGFAPFVAVPARNAYRLPEGVDSTIGALTEPLSCVVHGLDRANLDIGDHVAVVGAGPIGLMIIKLCRYAGASEIVAIEPSVTRRDSARAFGATRAVTPEEAVEAVRSSTQDYGADVVFEATGRAEAFSTCLELAAHGARIVVFGVANPRARVEVSPYSIYRKELSIVGALTNPYTHGRAVAMLPTLKLDGLVTHSIPLANILEGMQLAREGRGLKVQINPSA